MKKLNGEVKKEVRIRGQIIALSLKLEDVLSKLIYLNFKPISEDKDILNLYLEEFILPLAFGKKVSLFKQILKTEIYQKKMELYLETNPSIFKNDNISQVNELIDFINKNLSEILKTRNTIAHGIYQTDLVSEAIDLKKGSLVFANKLKAEIFEEQSLKDFSEKTLLTAFVILTINKY